MATGTFLTHADPNYDPEKAKWDYYGGMDPSSASRSFYQSDPAHFSRTFLTTGAPQRLNEFETEATGLIGEQFRGALLEQLGTMSGRQQSSERRLTDQLAGQGVAPSAALGRLIPEQRQQFAAQAGALKGGAVAGEAQMQLNLQAQLVNAMNQIEAYYDSLNLQNYLAAKARKAARHGAKNAAIANVLGSGLTAAALYFGGPPAAAGTQAATKSFSNQQAY